MYGKVLPYKRRIHFDGNSLMNLNGSGASPGITYGYYLGTKTMSLLTATEKPVYFCYGIGGRRTQVLINEFPTKILPNFQKGDIVVMWEITNDAHDETTDTTGAVIYSRVVDYCNMVRSYGGYIILITGIARDMTGFDDANISDRIFACNALIRTNAANICDGVADFGALSIFDQKADAAVSANYMTDRTHIKNAAYDTAAPSLATVIDNLLLSI